MKTKVLCGAVLMSGVMLLGMAAVPALAHHSFTAEFNAEKLQTFTGTLTQVDWINPHIQLYLDGKDVNGQVVKWKVEGSPTVHLRTAGLTKSMFSVGQVLTIQMFMAKDGTRNFGFLRTLAFVGGTNGGKTYVLGSSGGVDQDGNAIQ